MKICYIDEAGDGRRPNPSVAHIPPVLAICGLVIASDVVPALTRDFLKAKKRFHPGKAGLRPLDGILNEVKGSDIRKDIRSGSRRRSRAAIGFLDTTTELLTQYGAGIVGRVWVKHPSRQSDERSMYTFSIQDIALHLQHHLQREPTGGLVICDSRSNAQNANVAHSVFTKMFKRSGNSYPNIVEMPVFGHSENHAGLQLADLVTSALIFPIASRTYCQGHVAGPHVHPSYDKLKSRYGTWLKRCQIRYQNADGRWVGGITVSDTVGRRSGGELFR
ncbi:MAG: DUF3800 domain-containing protein [bacterium]|nr:DUF3800 domain-containing protein [bacterium]